MFSTDEAFGSTRGRILSTWWRKLHAHSRTFRAFQVYLWRYLVGNVARSQACIRVCPNMLVSPCLLHIWAQVGITFILYNHNLNISKLIHYIALRYTTLYCIALHCVVAHDLTYITIYCNALPAKKTTREYLSFAIWQAYRSQIPVPNSSISPQPLGHCSGWT